MTKKNFQKLKRDQEAFNAMIPDLLKTRRKGQWVLFRDGKVVSYHKTCIKAYSVGLKKFGTLSYFIIDQVAVKYPVHIGWY